MVDEKTIWDEPQVKLPTTPDMNKLGTTSELAEEQLQHSHERIQQFKESALLEIEQREERGELDRWYDRQANLPPKINDMKGFKLEMLFSYNGDDGTQCLGWYHGVVEEVLNVKTSKVRVRWNN